MDNKIKDKIKKYKSMILISDDGFQAIVHTNNYNDGGGNKTNAILVYDNNGNGDGLYGKPVSVICGIAYNIITKLNK
mgnify:CR=1 FL=1